MEHGVRGVVVARSWTSWPRWVKRGAFWNTTVGAGGGVGSAVGLGLGLGVGELAGVGLAVGLGLEATTGDGLGAVAG